MAIKEWSDDVYLVELSDDPQLTDDLTALMDRLEASPRDVVINFGAVGFVNSSNIARLLRLRKMMIAVQRRLIFSDVNSQVWGVFVVTGLDKIFEFVKDVSTALATMQIGADEDSPGG
jgi:anti-anti-sigma factor